MNFIKNNWYYFISTATLAGYVRLVHYFTDDYILTLGLSVLLIPIIGLAALFVYNVGGLLKYLITKDKSGIEHLFNDEDKQNTETNLF